MPRKLDFATSSRRGKRRELRERMAELEDSIKAADEVLAEPTATAATKGRLIAARQGWRDTLRELRGELRNLSARRRPSAPAESGQEAAEPEPPLTPQQKAWADFDKAKLDMVLNGTAKPTPPPFPRPKNPSEEEGDGSVSASSSPEGQPKRPPEALETTAGEAQTEPLGVDASPEPATPPSRPENGKPFVPVLSVWRDGVPCDPTVAPGIATGSDGLPLDPVREMNVRDAAEKIRRRREEIERRGLAEPLNL